jgi:hypothetical protein
MCDEKKYFTFRNFSFANKTTLFGLCNQQKRQKSTAVLQSEMAVSKI